MEVGAVEKVPPTQTTGDVQALEGVWGGALAERGYQLRARFNVIKNADGRRWPCP
jgi:hypothetical protein